VPEPTANPSDRSESLVRRAQQGDRGAFDALIRRSEDRLIALVRARMGTALRRHEESRDIVQSVLREAVADLPDFEYRGEGSFLAWLSTVVRHKVAHRARDLGRDKRDAARERPVESSDRAEVAARADGPLEVAIGHEAEQRYHAALASLPDPERELLLLYLELGCAYEEIAGALAIPSPDAVRKRIARALAKLNARMEEPAP
jgi:RNA polymerase sigma-70 factor (ECF subfamily)